jgi:hypothetical protein
MAKRGRKKGGARYRRITLSLPKRLYYVLNGIAMGDEKKAKQIDQGHP